MKQSDILLNLFYLLLSGKTVQRESFCCDMHVSARSFYRYLAKLRGFCIEFGLGVELVSDGNGGYFFIEKKPQ